MTHAEASVAQRVWLTFIWPSLAFIIVLATLPVLAPFLLIMRAYRAWVSNKLLHQRTDVQLMKEMDAMFRYDSPNNLGNINALFWLSGRADTDSLESMQANLDKRVMSSKDLNGEYIYPKLRSYVKYVWHRHVWCPIEDFDIKDYITLHDECPKDKAELAFLLGRLASVAIPSHTAQWRMVLVPVSEEQYVCMFKVHHSIGDGGSLVKMMMASLFDEEVPLVVSRTKMFATKTKLLKIIQAAVSVPRILLDFLLKPFDLNALHGPTPSGEKLVAWSHGLDLDFVKQMKTAGGCTVNDILMSILARTFQAYFRRHCSSCPRNFCCLVPVDVRRPVHGDRTLDNNVSFVLLELPLNEDNPLEALKETKYRMDNLKRSPEPMIYSWALYYGMARLPGYLSKALLNLVMDKSSAIVSNVPGPQEKLRINGDVVEGLVFWPPGRGRIGIDVSLFSYNGKVTLGIMVDKVLLSNPQLLLDLFREHTLALAKELGVPIVDGNAD